jgi:hypothetical protein
MPSNFDQFFNRGRWQKIKKYIFYLFNRLIKSRNHSLRIFWECAPMRFPWKNYVDEILCVWWRHPMTSLYIPDINSRTQYLSQDILKWIFSCVSTTFFVSLWLQTRLILPVSFRSFVLLSTGTWTWKFHKKIMFFHTRGVRARKEPGNEVTPRDRTQPRTQALSSAR